ncbi:MAG: hypothetical protein IPL65_05185 [Lewinellaceae bacterium]|nr:hypothetical protein [Lewinellaceae bacterium]
MERTIYQVFEVDSARTVTLDIAGIYEIHPWAGTNILAETNIQIWHASPEILGFLIKEGRYDLVAEKIDGGFEIYTKDRNRKPLKTKEGEVTEIATAKIFVPDFYTWTQQEGLTLLQRKP